MVCVKVLRRERDWWAWEQKDDQWSWPFWPYQEFGFYFKWAGSYWGATKSGLLFSLSLAFLGTKMLDHFLTGIFFTLDHRFSFLKLRIQSLTFSCWLGLSIHYSLVLSSTGRTEAFEPRSLGFYHPTSFFFLYYQKSLSLRLSQLPYWKQLQLWPLGHALHCLFYAIKCTDFVTVIAA